MSIKCHHSVTLINVSNYCLTILVFNCQVHVYQLLSKLLLNYSSVAMKLLSNTVLYSDFIKHIHVFTGIHIRVSIIYTYMYLYLHVYIHVYTYMYVYVYTCTCS